MKTLTINSRFISRAGKEISKNDKFWGQITRQGVKYIRYGLHITIAPKDYEDHYNVFHKYGKHLASFTHNHGTDDTFFLTHKADELKINLIGYHWQK